ncbi:MAG TPA: SulP family inorganic anion transporter, partial [Methylophilaceae bacterium]|nr:SulP family inorganic anion transporter [Methylophilaceae bacterium]
MGIAIASGMPPTAGIVTGIIGGIIVGSLSGSPLTVSGPAAGLVVLVADMIYRFGLEMLPVIVLLAGLLQLIAGAFKMGNWFRAISPAVIHGMLAGIGLLIIGSQFHIMLDRTPLQSGFENLVDIPSAFLETVSNQGGNIAAAMIGVLTIVTIVLWTRYAPKKLKAVPGALVGVLLAMLAANLLDLQIKFVSDLFKEPATISTLFDYSLPGWGDIKAALSGELVLAVVSLAFIASAESLLSVTAVDKMHRGPRAKYDKELMAQGLGNSLCGMLGALPMTGVIVRSTANIQAGATSRWSTIMHGFWLLIFVWAFLFTFQYIPVATLAAVLVYTGYKLAYPKVLKELWGYGKAEVAIYLITILTIVLFDLLTGVITGLALSLIKLVYIFAHLVVWVDHLKDGRVTIHLKGSATFIELPKLANVLENLELGRDVTIEFDDLEFMDHACIELIDNWQKQYQSTGGHAHINWDTAINKYHEKNGRRAAFA